MGSNAVGDIGIAQAAVATIGAMLIVGLGLLRRPSRGSLLWSLAFVLAMVSTWVVLTGDALQVEPLRRIGLGMLLAPPALIWSGFRARRGVIALPWVALVQAALSATALVAADVTWYGMTFRVLFAITALFAGLTLIEIRRSADRSERLVMPLALVSAAFVVMGLFTLLAGILFPADPGHDLEFVRLLNSLGMLIYLICATISLLFVTSVSPAGGHTAGSWPQFTVTARDRLQRARAAGESSWALLAVRIDDPDDIRGAVGEAAFARIVERFETIVRDSFPAEADVGSEERGRLAVLIARPGPVIREHVRTMLAAVTEMDATRQIAVQLSASVGWAPADLVGYDFDVLLAAAQNAAEEASEIGGDRWRRIGA